jgi:Zn-dependent protease/CBS domain-containing protein
MRGFRLGRIAGIEIRIDWSWVFIFLLLTWNLVSVFSQWHPRWPPPEVFAVAATASLLFFGCVLLHELAHSAVAIAFGMRVRSITLFLFGGVSNIEHEPPSAKVEFLMAVAGPLTSIVLGAGALLLASVVTVISMTTVRDAQEAWGMLAQLSPLATLLVWLGPINIVIGVFNLVPGFPLDGGRVLRSALWSATGSFRVATQWASVIGQTIGWTFIACGIAMTFGANVPFFGTGVIGGLWIAFIGWFLRGAALQAYSRLALDEALAGMTVEQIMRRQAPVAPRDLSVAQLVRDHFIGGDDRALLVAQDGVLLGLVSVSDVRRVPPEAWPSTTVEAIMKPVDTLQVAHPAQPLAEAFEQLAEKNIEQMPVLEAGHIVGVLRRRDIARWLELSWRPTLHGPTTGPGSGREHPMPMDLGRGLRPPPVADRAR